MRVFLNTQAPLTFPGMLSTAGHRDQSSGIVLVPFFQSISKQRCSHARRRVVHFHVTEHPTQEWTMQQIREAFPWDSTPRYLLRDRDAIYGRDFAAITEGLGWRTW
jgi:hypothetical protein